LTIRWECFNNYLDDDSDYETIDLDDNDSGEDAEDDRDLTLEGK